MATKQAQAPRERARRLLTFPQATTVESARPGERGGGRATPPGTCLLTPLGCRGFVQEGRGEERRQYAILECCFYFKSYHVESISVFEIAFLS